jgi:1-aminocyclopropane-1-carboxylate deaminase/D-cysteine desulfhydrase-like pyridoxal-dependent ACC family enzyme
MDFRAVDQTTSLLGFTIRRLDLLDPEGAQGNKAFKLRLNLERAAAQPSRTLLTFGGPFSNHLLATAIACQRAGIRAIGIVRGGDPETEVMAVCRNAGMTLIPVSRATYREKTDPDFLNRLRAEHGNPWIVPEGGSNDLGIHGAQDILCDSDVERFDVVVVAVGTGTTLAGMAIRAAGRLPILGVSALKGVDHASEVSRLLGRTLGDAEWAEELLQPVRWWRDAHEGGFGQKTAELQQFIATFHRDHGIPLDRVYTGKLMLRLHREWLKPLPAQEPLVRRGNRILIIHTGGMHPAANQW